MLEKKLLIASSSKDEAITQWILQNDQFSSFVDIIFIQDMLDNFDIRDQLDRNGPVIRWTDIQKKQYSNKTHYLLNRIIYIEEYLFDKFKSEDKDYAQREFEAYLGFAFNAFISPQHQAINGVCERFKTLPQQWQMVKSITGLSIPNYYWGSSDYKFLCDEEQVVYSDIYDCLNWSANQDFYGQESRFRFVKPKGSPVFVFSMGERYFIANSDRLNQRVEENIGQFIHQLRALFGYFIFELLLFVDEEQITFGCINIDVIESAKDPEFGRFMQKYFVEECSKCLN